jgi:hypothetical protein
MIIKDAERSDLPNLRLATRTFSYFATRELFSTVCLYLHWNGDCLLQVPRPVHPKPYDSIFFRKIVRHPDIRNHVRTLNIYTCDTDCVR